VLATSREHLIDREQVEALVEQVQRGDREQYASIVGYFQQPVYRYCCRLLGNRQDAEDAVQDILVKAYQAISGYTPGVSFSAWLYRIAGNHCLNLLRRRRLQGQLLRIFRPDTAAASAEQQLEARLFSPALESALARLSLEERNILVLRVFEELTFQEMGQILNCSPNALHKRMERIKRKVREFMQTEEGIAWNEPDSIAGTKI
jgi:RNA polymerase sigma-70 factor (ECF subfamily)